MRQIVNSYMFLDKSRVILYGILIVAILVALLVNQQAFFKPFGQDLHGRATDYGLKIQGWVKTSIYPKISSEVKNGGEVIGQEATKQKDIALKNIWENIKKYLAEKFSKTFGTKVE